MSVRVMGEVWELDLPASEQQVLLALADHAGHDGRNAFPAVELLAWKCGCSQRKVQYVLRALEERGLIRAEGDRSGGRGRAVRYSITLEGAPRKQPLVRKGENPAPFSASGNPEKSAPITRKGENPSSERVKNPTRKGATAIAPEPSVEPSLEPSVSSDDADASSGQSPGKSFPQFPQPFETLGDSLRSLVGKRPHRADPLHAARSRLMAELRDRAWLDDEPPGGAAERAHEARIIGELLGAHTTESDIRFAIVGAREVLGPHDPFSIRLLLVGGLFGFFRDVALRGAPQTIPAEVRTAIAAALAA